MVETVTLTCKECGLNFQKSEYEYNNIIRTEKRDYFFCSLSCGAKHQGRKDSIKAIELYNSKPKRCRNCDIELPWESRKNFFCSKRCGAILNNKKRNKISSVNNGSTEFNPKRVCLNCGSDIKSIKYCSILCQSEHRKKKKNKDIEDTGIVQGKITKEYLKLKFGNRCEICKTRLWLGRPLLLLIDHIDGNSKNNTINNLRLICSNCDSQTSTYKNRNKGRGRFSRRDSYRKGLSY